jgi:hypothetical protein
MLTGFALLGAALLSGCPIYPDERLVCDTSLDCPNGYSCSDSTGYCYLPGTGGGGNGPSCNEPTDCDFNETCSAKGVCRVGDCSFHGCVSGYTCAVDQGTWRCVAGGGTGGTGGSDAGSDASDGSAGSDASGDASTGGTAGGGTGGTGGGDAASDGTAGSDATSDGSAGSDATSD